VLTWFRDRVTVIDDPEVILNIAGWCPLLAMQYAEASILQTRDALLKQLISVLRQQVDPVSIATDLQQQSQELTMLLIMTFIKDLLFLSLGGDQRSTCHLDRADVLAKLVHYMDTRKIMVFWKKLMSLQQRIRGAAVPNKALVFDMLLLQWYELFHLENRTKA